MRELGVRRTPTTQTGLFNRVLSPCVPPSSRPHFVVVTWNARGLFHGDGRKLRKKVGYLESFARRACIIHIQETHGSQACVDKFCQMLKRDFWVFGSFLRNEAGGILTLVSRSWAPSESSISFEALAPGRVGRICIQGAASKHISLNVHNYGIQSDVLSRVLGRIRGDVTFAKLHLFECTVSLSGDLNLSAIPGQKFDYTNPLHDNSSQIFNGATLESDDRWNELLDQLTEVTQPSPTHFWPASGAGNIFDKQFTSVPSMVIPLTRWSSFVYGDPYDLYRKEISDHAPVFTEVGTKPSISPANRPIQPAIFKDPDFTRFHEKLVEETRLHTMPPQTRLDTHKTIIRQAALLARRKQEDDQAEDPKQVLTTYASISRAYWENNTMVAKRLIQNTTIGDKYLEIRNGKVEIKRAAEFTEIFRETKSSDISSQRERLQNIQSPTIANKNKTAMLARIAPLWIPIARKLILNGIKTSDGIERDPNNFCPFLLDRGPQSSRQNSSTGILPLRSWRNSA